MGQTNFFSLPRELRDSIYALGFSYGNYSIYKGPIEFQLDLRPHIVDNPKLPLWLLASKQIMEEGLEQFYREAICKITIAEDEDHPEMGNYSVLKPQGIQHLRTRLELDVCVPKKKKIPAGDEVFIRLTNPYWGYSHTSHKPFLDMPLNAKSLTVTFKIFDQSYIDLLFIEKRPPQFTYRFHVLEAYGQSYERVNLEISQPYLSTHQRNPNKDRLLKLEIFYTAFQKEIRRWAVGKVSGPENHPCAARDWMERYPKFGKNAETAYKWCFEARRAEKHDVGALNYTGVFSYEYGGEQSVIFGQRTEGEDGLVEWSSDQGEKKSILRPQWLVDLANEAGGTSILGKRKLSG